MPLVPVGSLKIYHEQRGSGPRLLVISGTGSDLRRTPGAFDMPFVEHFEVLAYDHRGMGRSDKRGEPCTMADFADDAAGLLDALGWISCAVLGISFGGMVAQELALRYPQRVTRLCLACTSSGGAGGASYPLHEWQGLPVQDRAHRMLQVGDLRRDASWRASHVVSYQALYAQMLANMKLGEEDPMHLVCAQRQLDARRQHDAWDRLPQLAVPVLVCGGLHDGIASPENVAALASRVPGAQLALFDGGHQFYLQDAAAFPRMVSFLLDLETC